MGSTALLIFLLINVFLIGAAAAIAARHAIAHFWPHEDKAHPPVQGLRLPPEEKEKILAAAEKNFQSILGHSADELNQDLAEISKRLNKELAELSSQAIDAEKKRIQESFDGLKQQVEATLSGSKEQMSKHQAEIEAKIAERRAELEAKLGEDINAEKQRLFAQIDTKLSDAVAAFLIEALQHDVDLGAQSDYLTKMLEEHKDEFKKGVGVDEARTS